MDNERLKSPEELSELRLMSREILFLAEQCADTGIRILPGSKWSFHYDQSSKDRSEAMQRFRSGEINREEVAEILKPDALIYDLSEIRRDGIEIVSAKIRDRISHFQHYDYSALSNFLSHFPEGIDTEEVHGLFETINKPRLQKKLYDAYGQTGKGSLELALRKEAEGLSEKFEQSTSDERVNIALKLEWLVERRGWASPQLRDEIIANLTEQEKAEFDSLSQSYKEYVERGDEFSLESITDHLSARLTERSNKKAAEIEDEEEFKTELEEIVQEHNPPLPGMPGDPAIPPQDQDEYHTPPSSESAEEGERTESKPIFIITPSGTSTNPLTGYYCSGRKSYYDIPSKTWSKNKRLENYASAIDNEQRQTLSGYFPGGLVSIPVPNGYALDAVSLTSQINNLTIKRDQNGCFYLESNESAEFKIDIVREIPAHDSQPIPEDLAPIFNGELSQEAETFLVSLSGSDLDNALRIASYIKSHHFYPGGGDLKFAVALQYKLRNESAPDEYIQNLEASEYLECYSANTLFLAMLRKAGIPSRLVNGHHIQGSKGGQAIIDENTGHAWSEVWDGIAWRRVDATPPAKPGEKNETEEQGKMEPGEEAQDGGMESQEGAAQNSNVQRTESAEADNTEMAEAAERLEQSQKELQEMQEQSQQIREEIAETDSFEDLQDLKKKVEESELLEDMKEDLEDKLKNKKEELEQEIKDEAEQMVDDGFAEESLLDELEKAFSEDDASGIGKLMSDIAEERLLSDEYQAIKEEIMPFVEEWLEYFVKRLPREYEMGIDEDFRTRQGAFDRRSVMRPRNLILGTVKNPRILEPSVKPRFLANIMVDVSGSMEGEKLANARKLLVFYNELFTAISREFGYLRFSISTFAEGITEIKTYDQDYDSAERYEFPDKTSSTIKHRLMTKMATAGGTDMLPAIKKAGKDLSEEIFNYPDYASALYFLGDGGDSYGNGPKIKEFLEQSDESSGFGNHMISAILMGSESERLALSEIFGDEHTSVASDFEELLNESMDKFDRDISEYLEKMAA